MSGQSAKREPGVKRKKLARVVVLSLAGASIRYILGPLILRERSSFDSGEVNRFDRWAIGHHSTTLGVLSYLLAGAAIVVPPTVRILGKQRTSLAAEELLLSAETFAINTALASAAKMLVQRPLPRMYSGQHPQVNESHGHYSFYSAHSAQTAGALALAATRSPGRTAPRLSLATLGTAAVAAVMIGGGKHFPSDTIVGAMVGGLVGTAVGLGGERDPAKGRNRTR